MIRGTTEAETLRFNGWAAGDILEGTESNDSGWSVTDRILITAIGSEQFLCRWQHKCQGKWSEERGSTTLTHREWKKVGV